MRVLCVGTVVPRKNLIVAAQAVSRLRRDGTDVRLRLVGPVRSAGARDLAVMQELLGDAVEVVGAVSEERLALEYAAADVVAYPSLHEGFGLPLLEAMAAGTAIVSSNATCLPEVAGEAAWLVNPQDDLAWSRALAEALSNPSAKAAAGLTRLRDFSWEKTGAVVRTALEAAAG